jgi:hypothetical protein
MLVNYFIASTYWFYEKIAERATSSSSFSWRDAVSILGIVLPLIFGLILYLIKKKQEAENKLHERELSELRDAIGRTQKIAEEACEELERHIREYLQHQKACSDVFVKDSVYRKDMVTQREHVTSMTSTIDTLNSMLVHQQQLVTQVLKALS